MKKLIVSIYGIPLRVATTVRQFDEEFDTKIKQSSGDLIDDLKKLLPNVQIIVCIIPSDCPDRSIIINSTGSISLQNEDVIMRKDVQKIIIKHLKWHTEEKKLYHFLNRGLCY